MKLAGMPQTTGPISAASRPKFTVLWGHLEETLLLNSFFSNVDVPQLLRYSPTKLYDGARMANFWRFFASCISASRVQHVSDLHPKFALRPHHVWQYGRLPISGGWD